MYGRFLVSIQERQMGNIIATVISVQFTEGGDKQEYKISGTHDVVLANGSSERTQVPAVVLRTNSGYANFAIARSARPSIWATSSGPRRTR
jgi:hypothetical protein